MECYKKLYNLDDGWACKTRRRRGQGTGRMSHLKDVSRKFRNGFRTTKTKKNYLAATKSK